FSIAEEKGNCIPGIIPKDSMRMMIDGNSQMMDRSVVRLIQTPQCFATAKIRSAYEQEYEASFTDDASVLEKTGEKIFLTEGEESNIKITTPDDLKIAETLVKITNYELRNTK